MSAQADKETKPLARSRKSAKKRDQIIRAATEVINEKTFALSTMSDIASRMDLRDATLYYYFPNKQALVYECHIRSLERFEQQLDLADQAGGAGVDRLRRFVRELVEDSARNGPQLYFGDHSYLEELQRQTIGDWAERLRVRLEAVIRDGMKDGSIVPCDPVLVVQLFVGMLIWLAKWAPDVPNLSPRRLMTAIEAFSFHGLESRDNVQATD